MANLTTNYMGLTLKNPIIASSSGLTGSLKSILALEEAGVGAIVVKSIFEEEIIADTHDNLNKMHATGFIYPETMEYFDFDEMTDPVSSYLKLISDAKKQVNVPIIASINCVTADGWPSFASKAEEAGADGVELNIFALPSDMNRTETENEKLYFDIISSVAENTKLPIAIKIGSYNSSLARFIKKLSETRASAIVLFNRSYNPDFDIYTFDYNASHVLSTSSDLGFSLRWIALMSGRVSKDLAASTGVHTGEAVVKQLLAGAKAVQVCSALYRNGLGYVKSMLSVLEDWMQEMGYKTIDEFRGKMSQEKSYNPAAFERVQFMKYFKDRDSDF
ncbi:MAG TPA: dihydroorotate dehydrogenase-like protein [Tenuifilaceae bacterium]|nr:dihydroorotate dehydrogenase-like protein [Tenuifilaceae bacterium]HPJ46580.1 dihydroorotate dehydrogenase-like protein [Tenuifilaceae bacterium]